MDRQQQLDRIGDLNTDILFHVLLRPELMELDSYVTFNFACRLMADTILVGADLEIPLRVFEGLANDFYADLALIDEAPVEPVA